MNIYVVPTELGFRIRDVFYKHDAPLELFSRRIRYRQDVGNGQIVAARWVNRFLVGCLTMQRPHGVSIDQFELIPPVATTPDYDTSRIFVMKVKYPVLGTNEKWWRVYVLGTGDGTTLRSETEDFTDAEEKILQR